MALTTADASSVIATVEAATMLMQALMLLGRMARPALC
jgi:hypothetical protein